jgi:DNA anti-recombination protein RmuC
MCLLTHWWRYLVEQHAVLIGDRKSESYKELVMRVFRNAAGALALLALIVAGCESTATDRAKDQVDKQAADKQESIDRQAQAQKESLDQSIESAEEKQDAIDRQADKAKDAVEKNAEQTKEDLERRDAAAKQAAEDAAAAEREKARKAEERADKIEEQK